MSQAIPQVVGVIGVGLMGKAIAERTGATCGWDLDPTRCFSAQSAQEVFDRSDAVFFCLPTTDDVCGVLSTVVLKPGQWLIDTSTGNPDQVEQTARETERLGGCYLDATVSGSSAQVKAGEVLIMVGGSVEAFNRCGPLLKMFGRDVVHVGPSGAGSKMKLVTNLVLGLNRAALAEGLVCGLSLGLDPGLTLSTLKQSMAYSRIMETKGTKMIMRDYAVQAKLSQHLKDVRLMIEASASQLPLTETHRALLERAEKLGYGDADNSSIIEALLNPESIVEGQR